MVWSDPLLYAVNIKRTLPSHLVKPLSHLPLNFVNSLSCINKTCCCSSVAGEVHHSLRDSDPAFPTSYEKLPYAKLTRTAPLKWSSAPTGKPEPGSPAREWIGQSSGSRVHATLLSLSSHKDTL